MKKQLIYQFTLCFLLLAGGSCDKAEAALDCQGVCDRYKDCINSDFDATACASNCRDKADDDDFRNDVDECDDCLGGSCVNDATQCATECASVISESAP
jgi:hypothetical protein